jgi:hypothetical protein
VSSSLVPWITAACGNRELSRYVPGIRYPHDEPDARAFITRSGREWAEGTAAVFVITGQQGDGLGSIAVHW